MADRTTQQDQLSRVIDGAGKLTVRWMRRLEGTPALDRPVAAASHVAQAVCGGPARQHLLQGRWLGHSIHPAITVMPLGTWTSASLLDAFGKPSAAPAARRLILLGLISTLPAIATGWAEWSTAGRAAQRVGVVHAACNTAATGLFLASYIARRSDSDKGKLLALTGNLIAGVSGYLGGHLAGVLHVNTYHPAFDDSVKGMKRS